MDIIAGINGLAAAFKLVKTIKETNDASVRANAILELQEKLGAAYAAANEAMKAKAEVEKQLAECEAWKDESARYELHDYGAGTFAYRVKEAARGSKPDHRLCANCYAKAEKSLLQFLRDGANGQSHWKCHRCAAEFKFGVPRPPAPMQRRAL